MKNLFKNLMLVAVAAMTFASCQNDNENLDSNVVSKAVNYTFTADFGETRAIFGELDGESYPVTWEGTETFEFSGSVLDTDGAVYDGVTFKPTTTVFSDDLKKVSFTVTEFEYSWIAALADNSVVRAYTSNNAIRYGNLNVDGVQKPTSTSVDSDFIGLIATFEVEDADTANFKGTFEHATAYGKLNVPVVEGVEFETVKITLSGDNGSKSYELDVTGLEEQSYWFACEPAVVNNINVSAFGSGKLYTYEKSFEEGSEITFTAGHVKPLTIKGELKEAAPYYAEASHWDYTFYLYLYDAMTNDMVMGLGVYYDEMVYGLVEGEHAMMVPYNDSSTINNIPYWYEFAYYGSNYTTPDQCQLIVEYLDNGYGITFNYIVGGKTSTISYEGRIEGIWNPGDLKSLATPEVSASANGNAITLSWDAVANAVSYTIFKSVEVGYEREYVELETVNSDVLTYTITDLEFNTEYTFGVQANAAQNDTNYKNSNIAGVTKKTTFDFNKPNYTIELTKVVSIEGNVITLSGDDAKDTVTIVFNPGLSSIVAGEYIGVNAWEYDSSWQMAPVWSSASALEFSCVNGTNFNISADYRTYGYYADQGNAVISIDADNNYNIVLNVVSSYDNLLVKYTYTGLLGGSNEPEPEEPTIPEYVFTSAKLKWNNSTWNDIQVELTTPNNEVLLLNFYLCTTANYIPEATYEIKNINGICPANNSKFTVGGTEFSLESGSVTVAEIDGKYSFTMNEVSYGYYNSYTYEYTNLAKFNGSFEGTISGLVLPSEYVEGGGDNEDTENPNCENLTLQLCKKDGFISGGGTDYGDIRLVDSEGKYYINVEVNDNPLYTHNYVCDGTSPYDPGTIYSSNTYVSYKGVAWDDETADTPAVVSGTFDIVVDGGNCTIDIDFVLEDGNKFSGSYAGVLPY